MKLKVFKSKRYGNIKTNVKNIHRMTRDTFGGMPFIYGISKFGKGKKLKLGK